MESRRKELIVKASQASEVLLLQAIELVDEEGEILSFAERRQANAALEGEGAGSPLEAQSARAEVLIPHVRHRASWLWQVTRSFSFFSWKFTLACGFLAALLGASVQGLGAGKTFHVLSAPLLSLLLWNTLSLGFLLLGPFLFHRIFTPRQQKTESSWGKKTLASLLWLRRKWYDFRKPSSRTLVHQVSIRALQVYWKEWPQHAGRLLQAQCTRTLHFVTISFGLSVLAVAYASGLTKAYMATQESTFLTNDQINGVLQVLFIPSQWILGPLPSTKANAAGLLGPAAPWIHHYAVTVALLVLLPRVALFLWTSLKSLVLSARLPISAKAISQVPTLNVALASHTNVGKTSLARTLLRRDVGEVRDAEHVTRRRAGYFLINTPQARLRLWDTPGFGDAHALTRHLRGKQGWAWLRSLQESNLRFDREAALSLREEADVILYLIPAHGGARVEQDLRDEWNVLREIKRPVLCLLNRLEGSNATEEMQLLTHWRAFFAKEELCHEVLSLDAFSRSLQKEQELFAAIERAVEPEQKALATQLRQIWAEQHEQRHRASGTTLARTLHTLSIDKERESGKRSEAAQRLQSRAQRAIAQAQSKILEYMGLEGEIRDRMLSQSEEYLRSVIPDRGERTWGAIIGGALSGLASGVVTDVMAGGMTFFGGAAIGTIVGALGGAGVAEGYRRVGKKGDRELAWEEDFLQGVALRLTLLYLAAASFGRAKGKFTDDEFLAPTPTPSPEKEQALKIQEHQAHLFKAAETALDLHWPALWATLDRKKDPQSIHLLDLPRMMKKPTWATTPTTIQEEAGSSTSRHQSNPDEADPKLSRSQTNIHECSGLERACIALLHEALQQCQKSKTDNW